MFTASATQWRRDADGAPCGLDYAAVAIVAAAHGCDLRSPRVLRGVQLLEGARLDHIAAEIRRRAPGGGR